MQEFNELAPLLDSLRKEAKEPTRYPARFILVRGLAAWRKLLEELRPLVDEVFVLSSLCTGDDAFPNLDGLVPLLKKRRAEKILVLPLAECLRFFRESGPVLRELATWEDVGHKRVYLPLLELDDIYEDEMSMLAPSWWERLPEPFLLKGYGKTEVMVIPFKIKRGASKTVTGIKAYLETWEQGGQDKLVIVSGCAPYLNLSGRVGNFEVRVCRNAYDFLKGQSQDFLNCRPDWGTERQWQWLADEIKEGEDFDALAARILNINRYDQDLLLSRWDVFDTDRKWFFWVWSKLRMPAGTLLHMVLRDSNNVNQLEEAIVAIPFKEKLDLDLMKERKELLKRLGIREMPMSFWQLFAGLQDPLDKLQALTGLTVQEKIQVILVVKELLENKRERSTWWPCLEIVYPELACYLTPFLHEDGFLTKYFRLYTLSRILDTPGEELKAMARQAAEEKKVWAFPTRESILEKYPQSFKFWVDGMGLEWLGLWKGLLGCREEIKLEIAVARTNLPTTSEFNKGWQNEEELDRRLDEQAHKNNYQFPSSFVEEIKVVSEDIEKMVRLLEEKGEVIVTSDHGLTRFAFSGGKTTPPQGAQVHKWGRYAELKDGFADNTIYSPNWLNDGRRIFLAVHEKFEGGGWSGGEVHGGATLEEWLVPVIRLRKVQKEEIARPEISIFSSVVRLNIRGEGPLEVELTAPVNKITLRVAGQVFLGISRSAHIWMFEIKNLKAGKHKGMVEYEGGLLGEIEFELVRGLMEEDLGL